MDIESLQQIETRLRWILSNVYGTAKTRGDVVLAILLMHTALDAALGHHVPPEHSKAKFPVKYANLSPADWHRSFLDDLEELNNRRNIIAHPDYLNPVHVEQSGKAFVNFFTDYWEDLFSTRNPPPNVDRPYIPTKDTVNTDNIDWRVRSVLQYEYGQAQTAGDMLESLLLLHKALERKMERPSISNSDLEFMDKVRMNFPQQNAIHRSLLTINTERNRIVHDSIPDNSQIILAANMMADFWITNWNLLGDGRPIQASRPTLSAILPIPQTSPRPSEAPVAAQPAFREPERRPRHFAWGILSASIFYGGLAIWTLGVGRVLWNWLPADTRWPAVVTILFAALWAIQMVRRANEFVKTSGYVRATLAVMGLAGVVFAIGVTLGWPPIGLLSGQRAGLAVVDFLGLEPPAPIIPLGPVPTPLIIDSPVQTTPTSLSPAGVATSIPETPQIPLPILASGGRARVITQGNNLNGRSQPGTAHPVVVSFANGSIVEIIDGPRSADGYVWWFIRGESGEGWSADEWLSAE